jgi:hypothetical protein
MLMCPHHWKRVPLAVQRAVWSAFRREQIEDATKASPAWRLASMDAVAAVAQFERRPLPDTFAAERERWRGAVEQQRKQEQKRGANLLR